MANFDIDILRLVWKRDDNITGQHFRTQSGESVIVLECGEAGVNGFFSGAKISIDGVVNRGDVVFGVPDDNLILCYAVLQVLSEPCDPLLSHDGRRIPQLVLKIPEEIKRSLLSLQDGSDGYECGLWLSEVPAAVRVSILDDLLLERMERKCGDIMNVFRAAGEDWGQTFHVMLFRAMGGNKNKEPYMRLASTATYSMVMRERSSQAMVEALLLGASGLLEGCYYDDYINHLREQFLYLGNKYRITSMRTNEWDRSRINPYNNPIIRIVQLASLLTSRDFFFDTVLNCRTRDDVQRLFSAGASDYWSTHYIPDGSSSQCPKRIGEDKADLFGINLVVPLMFAYGIHNGKEEMKETAIELLSSIPAEKNLLVRGWSGKGVPVRNALDSQAVIQLKNEYCAGGRCTECKIGRRIIKKSGQKHYSQ